MGMLIHLLSLLTGFLAPLILWLVKKDESRFIDHHGKEAINFILTTFIVSIPLMFLVIITFGMAIIILFPWPIIIMVFQILSCVEAYQGKWYHTPMTIRLIR